MADYTEVVDAGPGWTKVRTSEGEVVTVEGTRNWRNNNPGNLEFGPFAQSMGAIGTDGRFAVFPSYDAGRSAKENLIFSSPNYKDLPLSSAISRYAPSFENDTAGYLNQVISSSGVSADTPMSQIPASQRAAILDAMQRVEGWKVGTINGSTPPASAMGYAPTPLPRSQNPALNGINASIMRPAAAPPRSGLMGSIGAGLGSLFGMAGKQAAPIMRGAQSAGQKATPAIMRAAIGSVAGRTALIEPGLKQVFTGSPTGSPNTAVVQSYRDRGASPSQAYAAANQAASQRAVANAAPGYNNPNALWRNV